jgi:hypothetical protein
MQLPLPQQLTAIPKTSPFTLGSMRHSSNSLNQPLKIYHSGKKTDGTRLPINEGENAQSLIITRWILCHGEPWASNRDAAPCGVPGRRLAGFGPWGSSWLRPSGRRRNLRAGLVSAALYVPHHARFSFRSHPSAPFLSSSLETGRRCWQLPCHIQENTGEGVCRWRGGTRMEWEMEDGDRKVVGCISAPALL